MAETAVGRIAGHNSGHFGSETATPEASNASVVRIDRFYSHQNRSCAGFDHSAMESTPTAHDFISLHDSLGVSEVDCSGNGMAVVKTTPPDSSGYSVDCGISDILSPDFTRAVAHQGIFENPLAEEWTESKIESQGRTAIIDHVIWLCDCPSDSVMVKYIDQLQWSQLVHIVTVGLEEVDEFFTVKSDVLTFGAAPMYTHLPTFKSFLL
jgi:hypothetical protein